MSKKVLVVEDELPLAQVLGDKLKAVGYEVKTAGDGQTGLTKALDWKPDLVLLDIVMPIMDGMTMLHKLRATPEGKNMSVILLTNLSDSEHVYDATANGVFDFLVKSNWDVDDLVDEVQTRLAPLS
ncbi:MAG TPA: response regulator [Candidatus Saccharimonadales bacterium]|nr:response regulator [Candidatus Saccharimonadales bacterium]